ncbi:MAG: methyltransferase domain-containing protein [Bacteriovorax sp.]|nr:methyltransferase domain-containing protein [Bacteriovorax sp.]
MKSNHGFNYNLKTISVLDFEMTTLRDLDESIDTLCEFFGEDDQDNSLKEEYCPYFGVLWEAGIGLSQHLTQLDLKNKKILEIGCGLALPSFLVTRSGGDVVATDFHKDVPLFLELNQKNNNIFFPYKVMNWRNEIDRAKTDLGLFDLVIGSDILYESQHPMQVAKALITFLKPGGKIILSDPGRAYIQKFISAMNECGYKEIFTTQIVSAGLTQKQKSRDIFIFEFQIK